MWEKAISYHLIAELTRESRELAAKAKEIEDAVHDLKPVNSHKNQMWMNAHRRNS